MSKSNYRFAIGINTVQATLHHATELIELSQKHPEYTKLLSACAVAVLASAFQQGIRWTLQVVAHNMSAEDDIPLNDTSSAKLLDKSFREQMLELPGLISSGEFAINEREPLARALNNLITCRNKLMHIDDPVRLLTENSAPIKITNQKVQISIPLPENPWDSINLSDVQQFERAVKTYLDEAVSIEKMSQRRSSLLVRRSNKQ